MRDRSRRSIGFFVFCSMLAACSGGQAPVGSMAPPLQSVPQTATSVQTAASTPMKPIQKNRPSASRDARACPCLYVANGTFPGDVLVFGGGPVRPDEKAKQNVYGSNTGLDDDEDIAVDAVGDMYVTNSGGGPGGYGTVTIYAAGATGNVAPTRTIAGSNTGLDSPSGVALDPLNGDIYVTNYQAASVTIYDKGANGNASPLGTIQGAKTGLYTVGALALDARGNIYIPDLYKNTIYVYAAGATGNVAPVQTISGSNTKLSYPTQVAVDANDDIYVSNEGNDTIPASVTVYAAGANGNVTPIRNITGSKTGFFAPSGVALDNVGNIFVANRSDEVTVYGKRANGNVAPTKTISGSGLYDTYGIVIR